MLSWLGGSTISPVALPLRYEADSIGIQELDFVYVRGPQFLVSSRFKKAIQAEVEIPAHQAFESTVSHGGSGVRDELFTLHFTENHQALDLQHCEYREDDLFGERTIVSMTRTVLSGSLLPNVDVFRLREYPRRLMVSQRVKDLVEQEGFSGFAFSLIPVT